MVLDDAQTDSTSHYLSLKNASWVIHARFDALGDKKIIV